MKLRLSKSICLFLFIIFIGAFLRFYQLGSIPNSLNWDEVSWGYNAYSILQTGKDEYGETFPLSFKAFGDYKQPVYVYLDSIAIFFFGLTPFAIRFPSALLGTLSIVSVYFLVRTLFKDVKHVEFVSFVAMFLFAISPWSIQFSRVAYEANVASFFIITGITAILLGIQRKHMFVAICGIVVLAISGYTYHSAKLFTPLLFVGLLVFLKFQYKISLKKIALLFLIFLLASSIWIIDSRTTARGRSVLFTSNQTELLKASTEKSAYDYEHNDPLGALTHNRRFVYGDTFFSNYLSHYEPNFLFIGNDNPRHHPPGMGVLYIVLLPVIVIGMVFLIKRKTHGSLFLFYWFLIAPLAASLAIQAPNASRSLTFLPTWDIFAAFGFTAILTLRKSIVRYVLLGLLSGLFLINCAYYLHQYFNHTNLETVFDWQYGYKEAAEFAYEKKDSGRNVFFGKSIEQPYIFYLFYSGYSPETYISGAGSERREKSCYTIDHVYFGDCEDQIKTDDYYISLDSPEGENVKEVDHVTGEDGSVTMRMYQIVK